MTNDYDFFLFPEGTLRSFFFLDVAPVWPDYFEHEHVKTAQECSDICVRDAKFCIAFTFFPTNETCRKYDHSIIHNKISTGQTVQRRDSNRDGMYFEKLCKLLKYCTEVFYLSIVLHF